MQLKQERIIEKIRKEINDRYDSLLDNPNSSKEQIQQMIASKNLFSNSEAIAKCPGSLI